LLARTQRHARNVALAGKAPPSESSVGRDPLVVAESASLHLEFPASDSKSGLTHLDRRIQAGASGRARFGASCRAVRSPAVRNLGYLRSLRVSFNLARDI